MTGLRHFEKEGLIWKAEIDPESKLILLCLNQYLGGNECAWPSIARIAQDTGLSDKTIRRRLTSMSAENLGIVAIAARSKNGFKTTNEYTIRWESLRLVSVTDRSVSQSLTIGQPVPHDRSASPSRSVSVTDRSDPLDLIQGSDPKEKIQQGTEGNLFLEPKASQESEQPSEVVPQTISLAEASSDRKEEKVPPVEAAADFVDLSIRPRDWNASMPWLAADINEFTSKIEFDELRRFKNWLPGWRSGWNIVGIKPDFLEYIQNVYLPTTPDYKDPKSPRPNVHNARSWISARDVKVESYGQVFSLYQQFQCAQAAKKEAELRFAIASSEPPTSSPEEAQEEDGWKLTPEHFNDLRKRLGLPLKQKEVA